MQCELRSRSLRACNPKGEKPISLHARGSKPHACGEAEPDRFHEVEEECPAEAEGSTGCFGRSAMVGAKAATEEVGVDVGGVGEDAGEDDCAAASNPGEEGAAPTAATNDPPADGLFGAEDGTAGEIGV